MKAISRLITIYNFVVMVSSLVEHAEGMGRSTSVGANSFPEEEEPIQKRSNKPETAFHIVLKEKLTIPLGKVNVTDVRNLTAEPFLKNLGTLNETQSVNWSDLNYETLDSSGNLSLTVVGFEYLPSRQNTTLAGNQESVAIEDQPEPMSDEVPLLFAAAYTKDRIRRIIFKSDDRIYVPSKTRAQKFPFSAVVRVSTGCTGTLISTRHVLTSAHCVHDGKKYLSPIRSLHVGFLRKSGKMIRVGVTQVIFPSGWSERRDVAFDYAVLKLRRTPRRRQRYMTVGALAGSSRAKIHFAGFPADKIKGSGRSMWYSHCPARVLPQLLLTRCDATGGNSGSGVFVRVRKGGKVYRILIAVLSGYGAIKNRRGKVRFIRNVATRITPLKAQQICRWTQKYSNCLTYTLGS